jgi:hypothetical protein
MTMSSLTALFQKPRLIGDHHPTRVAQMIQHVAAQVIAHRLGVPAVEVQQSLHPIRAQLTSLLSDGPRVLPLRTRQQPQQVQPCPAPQLHLRETPRYPGKQPVEPGVPAHQTIIDYRP